ncbi:MAG: PAS domain S-box protein [Candidatus Rifleibacteriota bacterium]
MAENTKSVSQLEQEIADLKKQLARCREELGFVSTNLKRYTVAVEAANEGLWDWNLITGDVFFSPKYYEMLGYQPGEFKPSFESWRNLLHPEDLEPTVADLNRQLKVDSDGFTLEFRARCKDGTYRWIIGQGRVAEFDEDGKPSRVAGIHVDITDRKIVEQQLADSQRLLASVFNHAKDWIFVKDENLKFKLVNPAMCESYGMEPDEILGKTEFELFGDKIKEDIREIDAEVFDGRQVEVELKRFIKGEWRNFLCQRSPIFSSEGEVIGICGIARDVTSHQKMEQDYQMLFKSMLDGFALHEMIFVDDKPVDYRFVDVNPAFERITGLRRPEVIGKTVMELMPDTEKFWVERYGQVVQTGIPDSFENFSQALKKHFVVTAFRYSKTQFACIFQDVTDRKSIAEENEKMQNQLLQAQKMESVGRLAGGVAHDFNNLIGVIMGCAEMAQLKLKKGANIDAELDGIFKTAERSADLTRQLLAFARRQPISPSVINLNEAVESMHQMLKRLIGEQVELEFIPGKELWPIRFDPGQIQQILTNLCVNARDAVSGSGKIIISTDNHEFDELSCIDNIGLKPGCYVSLSVSDNGSGMDAETVKHIFEPFYTTKEKGKGTGLGLATVYGIINQNEGYVKVFSQPGEGTSIKVFIPKTQNVQNQNKEIDSVEKPVGGHETIMIVEDDETILDLTQRILQSFGYRVFTASRPGTAISIAENCDEKIDLLITDVVMPEMNGKDLSSRIMERFPELKVIFMSGYTAEIISTHGVKHGANFMQKPFHMQELAQKVRQILNS